MPLSKSVGRILSGKLTRVTLDRFIAAHASSLRTLDIGAQNGPYAVHFPRRTALDIKRGMGVQIIGDAQSLGIADSSFEVVLCTEVLEHLPEPQRAIDEIFRVLAPGGQLLLTTRFLFPIHDAPHDYFRFTKYGLRHLLRRFEILELEEETDAVGTLAVLLQRLGMQAETLHRQPFRAIWLLSAQAIRPF
jgi:ubiquinone/menaquinone biosynthesis C-methylase UbiE